MHSQNCIDSSIPFIRLSDEVGFALDLMQEFKVDRLAIVDEGKLSGVITENILLEQDEQLIIAQLTNLLLQYSIPENTHLFDVLKTAKESSTFFLPIVNSSREYVGMTSPQKILSVFTEYSTLIGSGGIIVLEIESRNYSLTELSKIVESNNALILSALITTTEHPHTIQVSLKINKNDLKDILASFERYQYTVSAVFHQSEYEHQLQERFDGLMRYLEV